MPDATTTAATTTAATAATTTTAATTASTGGGNQPFHADWIKQDGSLNAESYSRLPEDIKFFGETLARYKTPEELIRGFASTKHFAGQKGLVPLPANAPPEVVAQRKTMLDSINGVPAKPAEYGITKPADFPEQHWNQQLADNFQAWAHENSVSPAAAKKLVYDIQGKFVRDQLTALEQGQQQFLSDQRAAFEKQLRLDGIPVDRADQMVQQAAIALGFDLKDPRDVMALNNAHTRLAMVRHAIATGEDKFVQADGDRSRGTDARAEYDDLLHNKDNPLYPALYNPRHPQHKVAKERANQLGAQVAALQKR